MNYKKFIFIIGLHRSGTSFLHDIFRSQTDITGIKYTNTFKYSEGQHLQNILKNDIELGTMGKFMFNPESHQTETSDILKKYSWKDLFSQWSKYWQQPTTDIYVEKSPSNVGRTRLLQALFPNSYFVVIIRHPIVQALSNKYFAKKLPHSDIQYIDHWFKTHEILFNDLKYINNKIIFTYEELINNQNAILNYIEKFLNLKFDNKIFFINNANKKYYKAFNEYVTYEDKCNKYGYSTINYTDFFNYNELTKLI